MTWTKLELECVKRYGMDCFLAGIASVGTEPRSQARAGDEFPEPHMGWEEATAEPEEWPALIDGLVRAAWDWGESCGIDNVSFNEDGDSNNLMMRGRAMTAKSALYRALAAHPEQAEPVLLKSDVVAAIRAEAALQAEGAGAVVPADSPQLPGLQTMRTVVEGAYRNGLAWMISNHDQYCHDFAAQAEAVQAFVEGWVVGPDNPLNYPHECSHPGCGCEGPCAAEEANDRIGQRLSDAVFDRMSAAPHQPTDTQAAGRDAQGVEVALLKACENARDIIATDRQYFVDSHQVHGSAVEDAIAHGLVLIEEDVWIPGDDVAEPLRDYERALALLDAAIAATKGDSHE
jgi:hypothetical protein